MVEIPDSLHSLFSGTIEEHDGSYVITVPTEEIAHEAVRSGESYRIGVFAQTGRSTDAAERPSPTRPEPQSTPSRPEKNPPVDEGEVRDVTIESLGDQGDGIAKVARGYVVIVPEAHPGDEVTVEIEETRENVAFATVIAND